MKLPQTPTVAVTRASAAIRIRTSVLRRTGRSDEGAAGTELVAERQHSGGRQAGCRGPRRFKRSAGESEGQSPSDEK